MKKVTVNADMCIGCGLCIASVPDVFTFNDEGKSEVIADATDEGAIDDIIASCPVAAISWAE